MKYIDTKQTGTDIPDINACAVVALMNAFDIDYPSASLFAATKWHRRWNRGTTTWCIISTFNDNLNSMLFNRRINATNVESTYRLYNREVRRRMKISTFIKSYPTGTYYVLVRGHAIVIKNGVVYNTNWRTPDQPILYAWKIV